MADLCLGPRTRGGKEFPRAAVIIINTSSGWQSVTGPAARIKRIWSIHVVKRRKNCYAKQRAMNLRLRRGTQNFPRLRLDMGKSFRMLDEAQRRQERGQDVVVGA